MSPESAAPSGQALPAGTRLEEFEVERVLGTGGFGITYLARDTSLGRKVVIKENLPSAFAFRDTASGTVRPRSSLTEDTENFAWSLQNFLREADTLASLDHPGIVPVLRKFNGNGTAYFVMPFMEGLPLDELMRNRRERGEEISDDELRGLLEHVLDALGYLHARGIYHRDIKPGNILVTKEGIPVLIDFGSARQRLSERSLTVLESPGYTPFEQLQSRGNVGPWSDLYALGATVSKAISGEAPPKAMDRMRNDPYVWLGSRPELQGQYSGVLLGSLDRALEIEESARWQDAGQWQEVMGRLGDENADPPEVSAVGQREEDDVEAQYTLGVMYETGSGVAKDQAEAVKSYRKAVEQGDADAAGALATMYRWGRGVAEDYEEATKWFEKAKALWRRDHGLSIRDVQAFHESRNRPKLWESVFLAFVWWILPLFVFTLIFGLGSVILTGEEAGFYKSFFGSEAPIMGFWGLHGFFIIRWGVALYKASQVLSEAGLSQEKRSACRSYFKFVKSLKRQDPQDLWQVP